MSQCIHCTRICIQFVVIAFNFNLILPAFYRSREAGGLKNPPVELRRGGGMDSNRPFCLLDLPRLTLAELIFVLQAVVSEVATRATTSAPEPSVPVEGSRTSTGEPVSEPAAPIPSFQCPYSCAIAGCHSFCTRAKRVHRHHRCRVHQGV